VRKAVVKSLGNLGAVGSGTVPLICLLLKDQHKDVVVAAQVALEQLQPYRRSAGTARKTLQEIAAEQQRQSKAKEARARARAKSSSSADFDPHQDKQKSKAKKQTGRDKSRDKKSKNNRNDRNGSRGLSKKEKELIALRKKEGLVQPPKSNPVGISPLFCRYEFL